MAATRTQSPGWCRRWRRWWCLWLWLWWGCGSVRAEGECTEDDNKVTVAVVVSVFVTLVIVAIVLVIVYILLRRRHGGFLFPPKQTRKSLMPEEGEARRMTPRDSCYDNPIFSAHDTVDLEEGVASLSSKRNSLAAKSSTSNPGRKRSALSAQGVPDGPRRKVSSGSLDDRSGAETVSVWLQSQDIIGLGFNICGNMRDGIYVSQLHNRGPAVESGQIQVGDRIRSVAITYDNMVYEDALTILSYASPYPVQVTLHKERAPSADSAARTSEQIHHPLYRSQSLDTLPQMPREFCFKPKRWQSEVKSETRAGSPRREEFERRVKALSQSLPPLAWGVPVPDVLDVQPNVLVHATTDSADGSPCPERHQLHQEQRASEVKRGLHDALSLASRREEEESRVAKPRKVKGRLEKQADRGGVTVEQMVDQGAGDDAVIPERAAAVSSSPKTPPSKPERKKKTSSSSIASDDLPFKFSISDEGEVEVEDVCVAVKAVQARAMPTGRNDSGSEVEEEAIQPTFVKREVVISAEGFEFSPVAKRERQEEARQRPSSPNPYVHVKSPARPPSPDGDPVEEELIEAVVASRDIQMAAPSLSARSPNTKTSHTVQGVPSLDEDSVEKLVLDNPVARTAEHELEENSFTFVSHTDAQHVPDTVSQGSDDFITVDLSEPSRPGDRLTFHKAQSDVQLQQHQHQHQHQQRSAGSTHNCVDSLDWSGQRLVRSGSFSEIPQDECTMSDWTDRNTLNDDDDDDDDDDEEEEDDTSPTSGKSSAADNYAQLESGVSSARVVPSAGVLKGRDNLASLSDLSTSLSSSRSSSPGLTNGPGGSEGADSVRLAGSSVSGGRKATIDVLPAPDSNANSKMIHFGVEHSADNDADC